MLDPALSEAITRCPACQTSFRVSASQLSIAEGSVRCGACLNIFQAARHFLSPPLDVAERLAIEQDYWLEFERYLEQMGTASFTQRVEDADEHVLEEMDTDLDATVPVPNIDVLTAAPDSLVPDVSEDLLEYIWSHPTPFSTDSEQLHADQGDEAADVNSEEEDNNESYSDNNNNDDNNNESKFSDDSIAITEVFDVVEEDLSDESPTDSPTPKHVFPPIGPLGESIFHNGASQEATVNEAVASDAVSRQSDLEKPDTTALLPLDTTLVAPFADVDGLGPIEQAGEVESFELPLAELPEILMDEASQQSSRVSLKWIPGVFALLLVLLAQYAFFNIERYAQNPDYRDGYELVCRTIGCVLPDYQNTNELMTQNLVVRSHPERDEGLQLDVLLLNTGPYRQAFPELMLSFSDLNGRIVAARTFTVDEYLGGELRGLKYIPAVSEVRLSLALQDPGANALGYEMVVVQP